jgi:hypothetical protein
MVNGLIRDYPVGSRNIPVGAAARQCGSNRRYDAPCATSRRAAESGEFHSTAFGSALAQRRYESADLTPWHSLLLGWPGTKIHVTIETISPSMKHKRQHIVPNCYLSAWLEPVTPPGQQRALWKFAKDGTGRHRRSPQKTFVESDRYTVLLKNGERDLRVEHRLDQIENDFAGVLRRLERREKLTIRDRAKLAVFTAAMLGRTKRPSDHWKDAWQDVRGIVSQFQGVGLASQASEPCPRNSRCRRARSESARRRSTISSSTLTPSI